MPNGNEYRRKKKTRKPKSEWIAVPVPNAVIPRQLIEAAREAIKDNRQLSCNGQRVWKLSRRDRVMWAL